MQISEPTKLRYDLIDLLRGLAVVQMIFFHFCFLLNEFNLPDLYFREYPIWFYFRTWIVIQFLALVGVSLKLASVNGFNWRSYYFRLTQLFIYAGIITLASYFYQPEKVVIFGILQFILVASIVGLLFVNCSWTNLALGASLYIIGERLEFKLFDHPALQWFGLKTQPISTFDYVPFLPWFGVVLIGIFMGRLILTQRYFSFVRDYQSANPISSLLTLVGRHSLNIYILHMPILYLLIYFFLS